jgi:alkylhydroperoxidase family enzyme
MAVVSSTGVTVAQLRELADYHASTVFSDLDCLVLDYTVAMTDAPVEVSDDLFRALRSHFDDAQLVELTATIAWGNCRARFDHALRVESQGFSEGASCVLPERSEADRVPPRS